MTLSMDFFHRDMMTPKGEKIKTPIEIPDLKINGSITNRDI